LRFALALACCAALLAAPALAQPNTLAGVWTFSTAPSGEAACTISGRAVLTAQRARNRHSVRMQVVQHCTVNDDVLTEQACEAVQTGAKLEIDCRIVEGPPPDEYLPDNFSLDIRTNDLMQGQLRSGWNAPALWRRGVDGAIS
jgi:hypothetical protein